MAEASSKIACELHSSDSVIRKRHLNIFGIVSTTKRLNQLRLDQTRLPTPENHGETGSAHSKRSQKAALQHVKQKN